LNFSGRTSGHSKSARFVAPAFRWAFFADPKCPPEGGRHRNSILVFKRTLKSVLNRPCLRVSCRIANSLCPTREKGTMRKRVVTMATPGWIDLFAKGA
jgi:hypothetical protein